MNEVVKNWLMDLDGDNTSTYKFCLQAFILNHLKNDRGLEARIDQIHDYFVKRYWDNANIFKFVELTNKGSVPLYHSAIITVSNKHSLDGVGFDYAIKKIPNLTDQVKDEIGNFKNVLSNPISLLQQSNKSKISAPSERVGKGWLYGWDIGKGIITFDKESAKAVVETSRELEIFTTHFLAKFIEKRCSTPCLLSKLMPDPERKPIPNGLKRIIHDEDNKCFYCGEARKLEVEHFIPHSFLYDHPLWDLVLGCEDCNRGEKIGKFEKLPKKEPFLKKLMDANEIRFTNLKDHFKEFDSFNALKLHISEQYQNCFKAGHAIWDKDGLLR